MFGSQRGDPRARHDPWVEQQPLSPSDDQSDPQREQQEDDVELVEQSDPASFLVFVNQQPAPLFADLSQR